MYFMILLVTAVERNGLPIHDINYRWIGVPNYDSNSLSMKMMLWRSVDGLVLFICFFIVMVFAFGKIFCKNVGYRFTPPPLNKS